MKIHRPNRDQAAFSFLELLMILVVVVLIAGVFFPRFGGTRTRSERISCVNNLKNVGLAFRTFAVDANGKFPWQTNTLILPGGRPSKTGLLSGDLIFLYASVSNELSTLKILVCPKDTRSAIRTENFQTVMANQARRDKVPSYFIGLTASEELPESILSGDRNLSVTSVPEFDWRKVTANTPAWRWEATNTSIASSMQYDLKTIHEAAGNILLGDASVQQVTSGRLRDAVKAAQGQTNRMEWLMPVDH